jgi:hypothetical protein
VSQVIDGAPDRLLTALPFCGVQHPLISLALVLCPQTSMILAVLTDGGAQPSDEFAAKAAVRMNSPSRLETQTALLSSFTHQGHDVRGAISYFDSLQTGLRVPMEVGSFDLLFGHRSFANSGPSTFVWCASSSFLCSGPHARNSLRCTRFHETSCAFVVCFVRSPLTTAASACSRCRFCRSLLERRPLTARRTLVRLFARCPTFAYKLIAFVGPLFVPLLFSLCRPQRAHGQRRAERSDGEGWSALAPQEAHWFAPILESSSTDLSP